MLGINLEGKLALVAGVADDQGYGWAICKALKKAGAKVIITTWPPALNILRMSLDRGKLDTDLGDGTQLTFEKVYPLDAVFDQMSDVPADIKTNKRYQDLGDYTMQGLRDAIEKDFGAGKLGIVVHSLANGPEVQKALIDTSRAGYLAANSASAYSFVSMVSHLAPLMQKNGSFVSMSYMAAEKVIPGYGGGMSSAKAALEADTRVLAFEAGRRHGHRVNAISAGALASRAAKAIGIIQNMIEYTEQNAPLQDSLTAEDVGNTAAFLCSGLAAGITGSVVYVDKGIHAMGIAVPASYNVNA
ncbi:MAG TPA: enoyl-[acyl-carrier-protein] reductase [Bdellovibrionota bacterium]|jgi:enoyl-[acyl-carrier protein] reductase I